MAYHRSQSEEEARRFEIFTDILTAFAKQLKADRTTAPIFRAPTNLIRFADAQLASAAPFRSKASAQSFLTELVELLASDPALRAQTPMRSAFLGLQSVAAAMDNTPSSSRSALATLQLPGPLLAARKTIDDGSYFAASLSRLIEQICDEPVHAVAPAEIERTTRSLTFALLWAGFSTNAIETFASRIQAEPSLQPDYVVYFLPSKIEKRKYLTGARFDRPSYDADVLAEQQALTIRDRLLTFSHWFHDDAHDYTIVFRIAGAKGYQEFTIDDVTFYPALVGNPRYVTCISGIGTRDAEVFGKPDRMNAAVTVEARDGSAAQHFGTQRVSKALDSLRFAFQPDSIIRIDENAATLVVDSLGHQIGGSYSLHRSAEPLLWLDFGRIPQSAISQNLAIEPAIQTIPDAHERSQMRTAMHALRRASEAALLDDRLLESWVVMESLLSGGSSAALVPAINLEERVGKVIGTLAASDMRHFRAARMFDKIYEAIINRNISGDESAINVPRSVLQKTHFAQPGNFTMKEMLADLYSVRPFVLRPWLRDELERTLQFYLDASHALDELSSIRRQSTSEVAVIYQLRNQIVHQGQRDDQLLTYFAKRAMFYARQLIWRLVAATRGPSFGDTLMTAINAIDALLVELHAGNAVNVLD